MTQVDSQQLTVERRHPARLPADGHGDDVLPVRLETNVTEIGTLELWCVSRDGSERWKLEFNIRNKG